MNETVFITGTANNTSDTVSWGGLYVDTPADHHASTHFGIAYDEPESERRDENMRSLFRITVVNPKTEEVRDPILVIAKDEAAAKLKALLKQCFSGNLDDYDILVEVVGDVRAKKETQKVKVVKEEEE